MPKRKKPAARALGGLLGDVLSLQAGHSERSPDGQTFQREARARIAEYRDLTGAAQFAALALAAHFLGRAQAREGAHV